MRAFVTADEATGQRLWGRYGADAPALVAAARPGELETIPGTPYLWAELRWAARAEGVVHLDDLLLRRVRLGLLLPAGGRQYRERIGALCRKELGWDEARWEAAWEAYERLWQRCYSLPPAEAIPDWQTLLAARRRAAGSLFTFAHLAPAGALLSLGLLLLWLYRQGRLGRRS